jgi:hypothetical protein
MESMSLWLEIENMCMTIKHSDKDEIDWQEVRSLLRRAQTFVEACEPLMNPDDLRIRRVTSDVDNSGEELWEVSLSVVVSASQRSGLLTEMTDP